MFNLRPLRQATASAPFILLLNKAMASVTGVLKELLHSFPSLAMTASSSNATTLDIAATQGHVDIVNLLLESNASLAKSVRNTGKTALHSSARMGHVEVVRSLLSKDPSIGLRADKKGQTALHTAVKRNNSKIVLELLKLDSPIVNLEDNKGNTPLHIATRKNRPEFVQTLTSLESIKINSVNRAGDTALSIAEKTGHGEISAILRDAGALSSIEQGSHQNPEKHLTKTVSDIKYDAHSQLEQTQQTEMRVQHIKRRFRRFHVGGLSNAVNSNTIVAVLIATVAFAAIFTMPGQFAQDPTDGLNADFFDCRGAEGKGAHGVHH